MFKVGSDSGIENTSALADFFHDFSGRLDMFARSTSDMSNDSDPSIDLNSMAVCRPPPPKKIVREQQQQPKQTRRDIISSETKQHGQKIATAEIDTIVRHLKSGSPYGEKLVEIMRASIEKSWPPLFYRCFLENGIPDTWCPIIKMNNDNKPYVELLIKSADADEDPFSQLNQYSFEHMALCHYIMKQIHKHATLSSDSQLVPSIRPQLALSQPKTPLSTPARMLSAQPTMKHSTPQQQRQKVLPKPQQHQQPIPQPKQKSQSLLLPSSKQNPLRSIQTLNKTFTPHSESQRILPPRACKSAKNLYKN